MDNSKWYRENVLNMIIEIHRRCSERDVPMAFVIQIAPDEAALTYYATESISARLVSVINAALDGAVEISKGEGPIEPS